MKLEYAGFRPIISQHGISFKRGKDDKFIYLPFAYEILNALNNDYDSTKNHSHSIKIEELNMEKILKIISSIYSKIDTELDEKVKSYIKHLDEEEKEVENRTTLSDIEKNIYLENLKLMRTYKIQRAKLDGFDQNKRKIRLRCWRNKSAGHRVGMRLRGEGEK